MTDDSVYLRALPLTAFIIPTFNVISCGAKVVLCGLCKMVSRTTANVNDFRSSAELSSTVVCRRVEQLVPTIVI
jgi:hypothetical protein